MQDQINPAVSPQHASPASIPQVVTAPTQPPNVIFTSQPEPISKSKKPFFIAILLILLILSIGIGTLFIYNNYNSQNTLNDNLNPESSTLSAKNAISESLKWLSYTSSNNNYSFKYPPEWEISGPNLSEDVISKTVILKSEGLDFYTKPKPQLENKDVDKYLADSRRSSRLSFSRGDIQKDAATDYEKYIKSKIPNTFISITDTELIGIQMKKIVSKCYGINDANECIIYVIVKENRAINFAFNPKYSDEATIIKIIESFKEN